VPRRNFPEVHPGPTGSPQPGEWLYATRPGAELDLIEEVGLHLLQQKPPSGMAAHLVEPGLVAAPPLPRVELAFARQGFPVGKVVHGDTTSLGSAVAAVLGDLLATRRGGPQPWALDLWVPDSEEANPLSARAIALATEVSARLGARHPAWTALKQPNARAALAENGLYLQACLFRGGSACAAGAVPARDAPSLAPGGRLRVHVAATAPSRAAMKLEEAFAWLDRAPEPGDVCVDLGAAPGGWSYVLLARRAHVIAVDPARMARSLEGGKHFRHYRADAFHFDPGEPVDWLFSDMAWRPLEAAALYAKWARRGWARLLVANIKLPMKKKAEYLFRVREILEEGGWQSVRARQLYHDRDEVTLAGVRI
jgi:23S rRNA (cytidine2498-2'-O)-methyltransferase